MSFVSLFGNCLFILNFSKFVIDNLGLEVSKRWYVLSCKLNKEYIVEHQLRSQGYEVFCPIARDHRKKAGRLGKKPYFPGYIFVQVDLDEVSLSTFQWMPNTEGLVSFGLKPAYVPDSLVRAISRHAQDDSDDGRTSIHRGDTSVDPTDGSGALFDPNLTSNQRVQVLLRVLEGMTIPPSPGA